ncbi:membrane protein [Moraxella bovoculi]|uniref:Probable membrane transporter protein n=1 Tax=Moraxella bovoculi TaxID=386891 RepID=A0AAC8PV27_9GAMM|nr:sulfite exporter TauE/SafE family protein [Moraxella bovoculi]AKG07324.1 membrane protein [Moraxella bovoculi]AKG10071.1 membrane protein [Moraxella bovoculi]AKG11993.1 membrane protein [Moraxella bovoculi]AKG13960.1 membrane protein [Moraxella bovoculi]
MNTQLFNDIALSVINFITSGVTAITGVGGGIVLIGIMPMFMAASIIIPVHGASQLASNASRVWFGWQDLRLDCMKEFLIGAVCGAIVFGVAVRFVSLELIPLFIGIYILLMQWSKTFDRLLKRANNFYAIAFIQIGTGLFVGVSGPMSIALLNKKYDNNNTVVTTGALMATIIHSAKLIVYGILGFSFLAHWRVIVMMVVFATLGSWVGVRLRHIIPIHWLKALLPWSLTLIAIKIIYDTAVKLGWI